MSIAATSVWLLRQYAISLTKTSNLYLKPKSNLNSSQPPKTSTNYPLDIYLLDNLSIDLFILFPLHDWNFFHALGYSKFSGVRLVYTRLQIIEEALGLPLMFSHARLSHSCVFGVMVLFKGEEKPSELELVLINSKP